MPKEVEITITKKFYTAETAFRYARRGLISYGELTDIIDELYSLRNSYPTNEAISSLLASYLEFGKFVTYDKDGKAIYFETEDAVITYTDDVFFNKEQSYLPGK